MHTQEQTHPQSKEGYRRHCSEASSSALETPTRHAVAQLDRTCPAASSRSFVSSRDEGVASGGTLRCAGAQFESPSYGLKSRRKPSTSENRTIRLGERRKVLYCRTRRLTPAANAGPQALGTPNWDHKRLGLLSNWSIRCPRSLERKNATPKKLLTHRDPDRDHDCHSGSTR